LSQSATADKPRHRTVSNQVHNGECDPLHN
jgi:hypothetical protein